MNHSHPNDEEINTAMGLSSPTALQDVIALQEKMTPAIDEYQELIKNNRKLKNEIEVNEKVKTLLLNPQLFPLEMQKVQFMIETYSTALAELDSEAEKTLAAINL